MEAIRTTCKSLKFCFAISWKASKLYTLIRFVSEILSPVLPIASAFLTSFIINIIASVTDRNIEELGLAIIMSLGLVIFKSVYQAANNFIKEEHAELIQNEISVKQMDRAFSMDLEYFDKPQNYVLRGSSLVADKMF